MKKTFKLTLISALLGLAGLASAQSYSAVNAGAITDAVHAGAAVAGNGSSYSVANSTASAYSNGTVSTLGLPGYSGQQQALTGNTSATVTGTAYNTKTGSGVGEALSIGAAVATFTGNTSFVNPHQDLHLDGAASSVAGGAVIAGTAQDGFFGATSTAGFAASGFVGSVGIPGGAQIVGGVSDSKYATADVGAGAVTFTGGAPVGQTAAPVRAGAAVGDAHVSAWFSDPAVQ